MKRARRHTTFETQTELSPCPITSTPSADRTVPSPVAPTSIGPTPHRDGKVLGLFAFLDENPHVTPSKKITAANGAAAETPSRGGGDQEDMDGFRLGRTPSSVSKRRYLDGMVTPLKPTDGNAQVMRTPVSVSKLQFGTPSFLRRRPLAAVEETPEYQSPEKLRRTSRMPFARGLSAIVANLRKVEESTFDDEEEAMREMEGGFDPSETTSRPARPASHAAPPMPVVPMPVVPDSQTVPESRPAKFLGGFDDEGAYDCTEAEQLDRGQPMRIFRKKAPKRTHRKVNMRPTFIRRPAEEGAVEDFDEDDAVPETQVDPAAEGGLDGDSEFEDVGDVPAAKSTGRGKKRKSPEGEGEGGDRDGDKENGKGEGKGGKVRQVAKKVVNELKHANFRRLKLRSSGAKGGPGFGSRFRRGGR